MTSAHWPQTHGWSVKERWLWEGGHLIFNTVTWSVPCIGQYPRAARRPKSWLWRIGYKVLTTSRSPLPFLRYKDLIQGWSCAWMFTYRPIEGRTFLRQCRGLPVTPAIPGVCGSGIQWLTILKIWNLSNERMCSQATYLSWRSSKGRSGLCL